MGGMREKLEEAKRLASTKAKEVADAATERLNDTLEANPQAWSLADKAAKKAAGASAAMAATKNSIREAVDGSQQYDVLLKDKNRRILQLEDDVAMLQGKLKHALGGVALAEAAVELEDASSVTGCISLAVSPHACALALPLTFTLARTLTRNLTPTLTLTRPRRGRA